MSINRALHRRLPTLWFYGILSVCALLVVSQLTGLKSIRHLDLTFENNFASWWSGILLLIVSLHAFDGFLLWRARKPLAAAGWAIISAVLSVLSLDEIGTLHERAWAFLPWGEWLSLLPFAVLIAALLIFAVVGIGTAGSRKTAWLLVLGFFFLSSVLLQEFVELEYSRLWRQFVGVEVRTALEEGSELLGMLILLRAAMPNTQGLFNTSEAHTTPTIEGAVAPRPYLLIAGLVTLPALAFFSTTYPTESYYGHPSQWLAAVMFFLAGIATALPFLRSGERLGIARGVLALTCFCASLISVATAGSTRIGSMRPLLFAALSLVIVVCWLSDFRAANKALLITAMALIGLALGISIAFSANPFLYFFTPGLIGLVVYAVNSAYIPSP
jgi:hypothetical protein